MRSFISWQFLKCSTGELCKYLIHSQLWNRYPRFQLWIVGTSISTLCSQYHFVIVNEINSKYVWDFTYIHVNYVSFRFKCDMWYIYIYICIYGYYVYCHRHVSWQHVLNKCVYYPREPWLGSYFLCEPWMGPYFLREPWTVPPLYDPLYLHLAKITMSSWHSVLPRHMSSHNISRITLFISKSLHLNQRHLFICVTHWYCHN